MNLCTGLGGGLDRDNSFDLFWKLHIWRCPVNSYVSLYPHFVNSLIPHNSDHTISSFSHVPVTSRIMCGFPSTNWVLRVCSSFSSFSSYLYPPNSSKSQDHIWISFSCWLFSLLGEEEHRVSNMLIKIQQSKAQMPLLNSFLIPRESRISSGLLLVSQIWLNESAL